MLTSYNASKYAGLRRFLESCRSYHFFVVEVVGKMVGRTFVVWFGQKVAYSFVKYAEKRIIICW